MNTIVDDGVWAALPTSIQNELREQGIMPSRLLESSSAPPGMDPAVWMSLPEELKEELREELMSAAIDSPDDFDVIATLNLNGDYLSDALAAQVGGIGIAPGGNINYVSGHAIFEATHGTAPKYANLDKVNPCSVVLSGDMMLRHMGWGEAADMIVDAIERTIGDKVVTYDFARLMDGASEVKTSEFADAVIANMR